MGKISRGPREAAIWEIARRHSGNLSRAQLLEAGLSSSAIDARLKTGALVRRYFGVYCLPPARMDPQALIHAAVLAGGPTAVASHGSAAWLWGFVRHYQPPPEISLPTGDRRPRHILTHRCPLLWPRDVTHQHGVPTTTRARTTLDLAPRLSKKQLTRLVIDHLRDHTLTLAALEDVLGRNPLHPATERLTRFVNQPVALTRSPLEDTFLAFVAKYGFPMPQINRRNHGREIDALFADHGVIVELDGYDYHRDRDAFEDDRDRDAEHLKLGLVTVRITEKRLTETEDYEAERLWEILNQAST